MRDIIFRGRRSEATYPEVYPFVYGGLAAPNLIAPMYPKDTLNVTGEIDGETPYIGFVEVDPKTIGQYTGLRDKRNVPIFEGDILSIRASTELVYVGFENGAFQCFHPLYKHYRHRLENDPEIYEIVGNIHDKNNPLPIKNIRKDFVL